jgi:pimeloyl-ACP methyl ester carboxylesterase
VAILGVLAAGALAWRRYAPRAITTTSGRFPEELVYVRANDDILNGGAIFRPPKDAARPIAVIWVHGWGVNFYYPTYTMIARALAERGLTTLSVNTRMHDIGTSAAERFGKRIRGGGYWGVPSEEARDIAAWVDFAERQGFSKVVLAGHSAGWAAVRGYVAETQDPRVIGVVLASGQVRAGSGSTDPTLLAQATRLIADGSGDDLLRLPNRSFPSFVSAATYVDIARATPDQIDFFGEHASNPGVTKIRCPLLAFFGTGESDVGSEADLRLMTSLVRRQPRGPRLVETAMIQNADHMYTGEEAQVADTIAAWANRAL